MEINEKTLVKLVEQIMIQLKRNENKVNNTISKKDLYIIMTTQWEEEYLSFFKNINHNLYQIFTVVSDEMLSVISHKGLLNTGKILTRNEINLDTLNEYLTVFPVTPRDIIVKTALCISDVFETKWIEKCFVKGQKVIMYKSGIQMFTGREPESYIKKINYYYEQLQSFGVEITDDIFESNLSKNKDTHHKQVITVGDLHKYDKVKKITMMKSDIITSLAREKARDMGIEIIVSK